MNPRYNLDEGCRNNCVNCVIAYDLRQRGYDVIAKSRVECNVSKKATELWKNVEEKTANSFQELLEVIDKNVDARYFLGLKFPNGDGHAVILKVEKKQVSILDPQRNTIYEVEMLQQKAFALLQVSYWRIDNLEVTQTGYNACKGGTNYDI